MIRRFSFLIAAFLLLTVSAEPILAYGVAVRAGRVGVRVAPGRGVAVRAGGVAVRGGGPGPAVRVGGPGPAVRVGGPVVRPVPRPLPPRPIPPRYVRPVPPVAIGW